MIRCIGRPLQIAATPLLGRTALRAASLAVLGLLLSAAQSQASVPIAGTTSGTFVNPQPTGSPIVTTGVNSADFTWGQETLPRTS